MDHNLLSLTDKIATLGELEHFRRHSLRSAKITDDKEKEMLYLVMANRARDLRRKYQHKHLETGELDWCLVKSAATLKQLIYEDEDDLELRTEIESMADEFLSEALGEDLTGCEACKKDSESQE